MGPSQKQIANDKQCPLVAKNVQRAGDRTAGTIVFHDGRDVLSAAASIPTRSRVFLKYMPVQFQRGQAKGLSATYHFSFTGKEVAKATVRMADQTPCEVAGDSFPLRDRVPLLGKVLASRQGDEKSPETSQISTRAASAPRGSPTAKPD